MRTCHFLALSPRVAFSLKQPMDGTGDGGERSPGRGTSPGSASAFPTPELPVWQQKQAALGQHCHQEGRFRRQSLRVGIQGRPVSD